MMDSEGNAKVEVLVVDDDYDIREALTDFLRHEGYAVEEASNGQEALKRLKGRLGPDLILLDLMMPIMNGWQFCAEYARSSSPPTVPVVIMTGDDSIERKADSVGAAGYLKKPIDLDTLLDTVERHARAHTPALP